MTQKNEIIIHTYRDNTVRDPINPWELYRENGSAGLYDYLSDVRELTVEGKLHKGLHPNIDKRPPMFGDTPYRFWKDSGFSIYWGIVKRK